MKLAHPDWSSQVLFEDGNITLFVIENPKVFREISLELNNQLEGEEGKFILSDSNKEVTISQNLSMLTSSLFFDIENKTITTKIQSIMKNLAVSEDAYLETNRILNEIEVYADKLVSLQGHNVVFKQLESNDLIKALGFQVNTVYDTPLEKIAEYLSLFSEICKVKGFILLNLMSFFSLEEINLLIEDSQKKGISLLLLESRVVEDFKPIKAAKIILIDSDKCETVIR